MIGVVRRVGLALSIVAGLAFGAAPVAASVASAHLLLVVNEASEAGPAIAEAYQRQHGLGDDQVVRITAPIADQVARDVYERTIEAPIRTHLNRHRLHDRILVFVLTKGVPLRIAGTPGRDGTRASVDSELTLLYRRMTGQPVPVAGRVANPYFLADRSMAEARPFRRDDHDIYLVTRLDAFDRADALALVDRAAAATPGGRIVLDHRAALDDPGNRWLDETVRRLEAIEWGGSVHVERTSEIVTGLDDVMGYYGWGSGDPSRTSRDTGLRFRPGALAGSFAATDGRTFTAPPADWRLGNWASPATHHAGSPETLAGDLVREGVTGLAAQVADPFLDGAVRPHILFPAYVSGYSLVEAFYLAIPFLSWQTIVVGDPLARPFPWRGGEGSGGTEAHAAPVPDEIDPATELPRHFAARALARPEVARLDLAGVQLALKGESRLARGDEEGGYEALEEAARKEPRLFQVQYVLASRDERAGEWEQAAARYREVIAIDGRQVIALNNLAYLLAERLGRPGDALPFARRAHTLSGGAPVIADTLGWVHYRLGDLVEAARWVGAALRDAPGVAEIRLHAAAIALAAGDVERAQREFARAIELDPALAGTPLAEEVSAAMAARRPER